VHDDVHALSSLTWLVDKKHISLVNSISPNILFWRPSPTCRPGMPNQRNF